MECEARSKRCNFWYSCCINPEKAEELYEITASCGSYWYYRLNFKRPSINHLKLICYTMTSWDNFLRPFKFREGIIKRGLYKFRDDLDKKSPLVKKVCKELKNYNHDELIQNLRRLIVFDDGFNRLELCMTDMEFIERIRYLEKNVLKLTGDLEETKRKLEEIKS